MPNSHLPRTSAAVFTAASALLLAAALAPALQARQQPEAPPAQAVIPGPPRPAPVLFHESGCEQCHGANLAGTAKGPSLLTVGKVLKKEQIHQQISDGGGEMPPFADALQPDEIDRLVDFLATKKKAPKGLPPTPPQKPPTGAPPPSAPSNSDQ